ESWLPYTTRTTMMLLTNVTSGRPWLFGVVTVIVKTELHFSRQNGAGCDQPMTLRKAINEMFALKQHRPTQNRRLKKERPSRKRSRLSRSRNPTQSQLARERKAQR